MSFIKLIKSRANSKEREELQHPDNDVEGIGEKEKPEHQDEAQPHQDLQEEHQGATSQTKTKGVDWRDMTGYKDYAESPEAQKKLCDLDELMQAYNNSADFKFEDIDRRFDQFLDNYKQKDRQKQEDFEATIGQQLQQQKLQFETTLGQALGLAKQQNDQQKQLFNDALQSFHQQMTILDRTKPGYKLSTLDVILPPSCLNNSRVGSNTSLKRVSDLNRVFSIIPIFDNSTKGLTIREFLTACNSAVVDLGCELTNEEFKYMISTRLGSKQRSNLSAATTQSSNLSDVYNFLLNLYDDQENSPSAMRKLATVGSYQTLRLFIEDTVRLLNLVDIDNRSKAALFLHRLGLSISTSLQDKINEWGRDFNERYSTKPSIPIIINYLKGFQESIDESMKTMGHLKDKKTRTFMVTDNKTGTDHLAIEYRNPPNQALQCSTCGKVGHTDDTCFRNKICESRGRKGHTAQVCRQKCRLCGQEHPTVECTIYRQVEPVSGFCTICWDRLRMKLYHPMNKCMYAQNNRPPNRPTFPRPFAPAPAPKN